jgi:hypothetical protein
MHIMSVEGAISCTNTPAISDRLAPANNVPKPRVRGVQASRKCSPRHIKLPGYDRSSPVLTNIAKMIMATTGAAEDADSRATYCYYVEW